MLPSRGARCSRNAIQGTRVPLSFAQTSRLYSITARTTARRPQNILHRDRKSSVGQSRAFSSTPSPNWSWSSILGGAKSPTTTSSEFATSTSNEFALYRDNSPTPGQALSQASAQPALPDKPPPVSPNLSTEVHPEHHGTPLTGPEHFLPDPVTHTPYEPQIPLEDIPERIGYLKELGLDYGWGSSSPMQWLLEHLHIYTGLPWYGSAIVAAILVRAIFVRMQIKSSDSSAKWQQLKPLHDPLMEQLKAARGSGDTFKMAQVQKELMSLRKQANMKLVPMFLPVIGQGVLGFGIWRNLRGMAELPIPALEKESFLWMSDLSIRDKTFGIAAAQAACMYLTMKKNASAASVSGQQQQFQDIIRRALPVFSFVVIAFQPAIVQIYFLTSSLLNLGITSLIRNPTLRKSMGLVEFPDRPLDDKTLDAYAKAARSAGLNTAPPSSSTPTIPSSAPSNQNISWIDRQLQNFKLVKPEKAEETRQQREARAKKQREEEYELTREQELQKERARRNRLKRLNYQEDKEKHSDV